jgi:hypothetical protein
MGRAHRAHGFCGNLDLLPRNEGIVGAISRAIWFKRVDEFRKTR